LINRVNYKIIFEDFYKKEDPWNVRNSYREQYRFFRSYNLIKKNKYNIILDVGCGEGYFPNILKRIGEEVIAVDISSTAINRARARFSNEIKFICGDIRDLKFRNDSFDLICCLEMLYYVPRGDIKKIFNLFFTFLKDNGHLLVSSYITPFFNRKLSLTNIPYFTYDEIITEMKNFFIPISIIPMNTHIPCLCYLDFIFWMRLTKALPRILASKVGILARKKRSIDRGGEEH